MQPYEAQSIPATACLVRCLANDRIHITERHYPPGLCMPLHTHKHHYVIIAVDGQFSSTFGRKTVQYRPWSVTLQPAGVPHTSTYSVEGSRVLYARISPSLFSLCEQQSHIEEDGLAMDSPEAASLARQIFQEFRAGDDFTPLMLDSLLLQLVSSCGRRQRSQQPQQPEWVRRVEDMIRSQFSESLTLGDLSGQIGVHPGHLAREYKRWCGFTVGERIRQERLQFAAEQLAKTQRTLADIALSAGFADQPHFTATFKRATGVTPAKFRQSLAPR